MLYNSDKRQNEQYPTTNHVISGHLRGYDRLIGKNNGLGYCI